MAQTQRSLHFFAISTERCPPAFVQALARVKQACARVNGTLGELPPEVAQAVAQAAQEVMDGQWADEFPLSMFYEALSKKMGDVIESTSGITASSVIEPVEIGSR